VQRRPAKPPAATPGSTYWETERGDGDATYWLPLKLVAPQAGLKEHPK
jgi:hypothetical protein